MPIDYFVGTDGPTFNVDSLKEVYEALDLLHTQVMDNIGKESPMLPVLSEAMDKIMAMDKENSIRF